jgi:hypothetical protein
VRTPSPVSIASCWNARLGRALFGPLRMDAWQGQSSRFCCYRRTPSYPFTSCSLNGNFLLDVNVFAYHSPLLRFLAGPCIWFELLLEYSVVLVEGGESRTWGTGRTDIFKAGGGTQIILNYSSSQVVEIIANIHRTMLPCLAGGQMRPRQDFYLSTYIHRSNSKQGHR